MPERMTWTPTNTAFPEGTSPFSHYIATLGPHTSPNLPAGTLMHDFPELPPGDYTNAVQTVAMDGTVLASHAGPLYHVAQPVMAPVAMSVQVSRAPG